jgi:predicted GNAT family N-acyltransferase
MTLVVVPVKTSKEFQEAKAIRLRVFHHEQGFTHELKFDAHDDKPTTIHLLGKDVEKDKYVAVARVLLDDASRTAQIGRVAVLKECRGKSYGAALMTGVERRIQERVDMFKLSARFDKRGFYEKCGYERKSDEIHLDEGVEHCWMYKTVA